MQIYKPSEFAKKIGVSIKTLQRWDASNKFKAHRTPTNRRYYTQIQYDMYMRNQSNKNNLEQNIHELLNKSNKQFAVIQMDVNGFKTLNHIHGEKICNEILAHIENILSEFVKDEGILYRCADVFTMICPFDAFGELIDKIKTINPVISSYTDIQYRTSWGIYVIENRNSEIWPMFDKASIARQSVKNVAVNNINIYTKSQQDTLDKINIIENKMQNALDNNEFSLYLQPKYDINTNKIVGAEGLIRWIEPDGSIIMPNDFIPIFEKNGFVVHTDHFIWEETCKTLNKWKNENIPLIPISINASRRNLNDEKFVEFLLDLAEKYSIDKKYLEIEITESMNIDIDNKTISELKRNGFLILMDDFGTKYSSLNTLCDTDFDIIKLDKKILDNIHKNDKGQIIAQKIIALLRDIDLGIIAEGVETKKQVTFLKNNGCTNVQGYLYSKPMSVSDFEKILILDRRSEK